MNDASASTTAGPSANAGAFLTTRWTRVLAARGDTPEARIALGELCAAYWEPVFRFLRREGRDEDTARELTQEFVARLLAGGGFTGAMPERGRFRSFLLGALKHFLAGVREHQRAEKRGGGLVTEPLFTPSDTSPGLDVPTHPTAVPDAEFDRQWAYAVMARALATVAAEFEAAGRTEHFTALKPWLVGDVVVLSTSEAARRLGLNEGAVKVAIHRLRRRFRDVVRNEVAQTVPATADVDEELRYLVAVLSRN